MTSGEPALDQFSPGRLNKDGIRIHAPEDFAGMRKAGRLAADILDRIGAHVAPGVTTLELDARIHRMIGEAGAISATVGYKGYKHASCISINHVVCHGIPGSPIPTGRNEKKRLNDVLLDGDILNIDVTVIVDGWYGDSSRMYAAGTAKPFAARLIDVTHDALLEGIAQVRPGNTFGDIGAAIQRLAEGQRCSVVRDFCGHGLGRVFHATPNVLHYGRWGTGPVLEPGMFFTIEPMVNLGRPETKVLDDDWTAITKDRSLSAQFEHSVGVTETGVEVFTLSPAGRFHAGRDGG
jgi:methionyl aminopeptidase